MSECNTGWLYWIESGHRHVQVRVAGSGKWKVPKNPEVAFDFLQSEVLETFWIPQLQKVLPNSISTLLVFEARATAGSNG